MTFTDANIALFRAVNGTAPELFEPLMQALSWLGDYWRLPLYATGLAALALAFRSQGRDDAAAASAVAACRLLVAFAIAAPITAALKQALALPRPALAIEGVRVLTAPDSEFSFPSGHAVFAGVLAASLWPLLPRWGRVVALLFAGGVGISRVWLGAHFPGDVVAGILIGVLVATWSTWLLRWARTNLATALAFGSATLVIALDAATKTAIAHALAFGERIPVTQFFNIVFWRNTGAAFSFLHQAGGWQRAFLTIVALAISAWLVREILKPATSLALKLAYGLVLGGALGNVFDRVFRSAIVDWLDFYWGARHWPAFNVADSAITVGVAMLVLGALVGREGRTRSANTERH